VDWAQSDGLVEVWSWNAIAHASHIVRSDMALDLPMNACALSISVCFVTGHSGIFTDTLLLPVSR